MLLKLSVIGGSALAALVLIAGGPWRSWPTWALLGLLMVVTGAVLGMAAVVIRPTAAVGAALGIGAGAGAWAFLTVVGGAWQGVVDPDAVMRWVAGPPIGALAVISATIVARKPARLRPLELAARPAAVVEMIRELARPAVAGAALATAVTATVAVPVVRLHLLAAIAGLAAATPVTLWAAARRAAGRWPTPRWANPDRIPVGGAVLGLSAALQWTLGAPAEPALRLWPVAVGAVLAGWPLLGVLRSLHSRGGGWDPITRLEVLERASPRSWVALMAGAGAGALLVPGWWLLGVALLGAALIELGRLRLKAVGDDVAAAALQWKLPLAGGFVAGGVTYAFVFLTLITPLAFADQVGLPAGDWRIKAIPGVALAVFAVYLVASPGFQRWLRGGSRGSRVLGSVLLASGGIGSIAMAVAPSWSVLYVAITLGAACGAGGVLLKCQIAAAARARGGEDGMNKAVALMLGSNVVAVCVFPLGAALLIELGPDSIGGVGAHGIAFAALGAFVLAAWRLVPPLLRGGGTVRQEEPEPGLRDRRLWRGIALSAVIMAALGPIDAGLVPIIGDHVGYADAELWAGLVLLSSVPVAVVAFRLEPLMKRHMWLVGVIGAGMALAGAVIGFAVQGWQGLAWGIGFGIAYWLLEPATTLHWLFAEWVAIRNPGNYARVAMVTGLRQLAKALTAFVWLSGEMTSWINTVVLAVVAIGIAIPAWSGAPSRVTRPADPALRALPAPEPVEQPASVNL